MWKLTCLIPLLVSSCHVAMTDGNAMRGYVEDTRRETARHVATSRAASTIAELAGEMGEHRARMQITMFDVDLTFDAMTTHCDGVLDEMRTMHGELDGELAQHVVAMDAIAELAGAQLEIERHATAMMRALDGMDGALDRMRCW